MKPSTKDSVCITSDLQVEPNDDTDLLTYTMCTLTFTTLVNLRHLHLMSLIRIELSLEMRGQFMCQE